MDFSAVFSPVEMHCPAKNIKAEKSSGCRNMSCKQRMVDKIENWNDRSSPSSREMPAMAFPEDEAAFQSDKPHDN